jgi:nucleoid DNA-binding protein
MAIQFKVVPKTTPRDPKGPKIYHPEVVFSTKLTNDELIASLINRKIEFQFICKEILMRLRYVVSDAISDGKPVIIDDFGTFYPAIKTSGDVNRRKVGKKNIEKITLQFRPAGWIKKRLNEKKVRIEYSTTHP